MARPRVHLNWAMSLDGRVAGADGQRIVLSDEQDLDRVHGLRAQCDAIVVGAGTVRNDDPSLRVDAHRATGPDPIRVILDTHASVPADSRIFDGTAPTWILHGPGVEAAASEGAVRRLRCAVAEDGLLEIVDVLETLAREGIRSVLVEGGPTVIASFLAAGAADEITVFQADLALGQGPKAWPDPWPPGVPRLLGEAARARDGLLWSFRLPSR